MVTKRRKVLMKQVNYRRKYLEDRPCARKILKKYIAQRTLPLTKRLLHRYKICTK